MKHETALSLSDAGMQPRKNGRQAHADQRQTGWFGHGSEIEISYEIQACVADMGDLVPGHRVNCEKYLH